MRVVLLLLDTVWYRRFSGSAKADRGSGSNEQRLGLAICGISIPLLLLAGGIKTPNNLDPKWVHGAVKTDTKTQRKFGNDKGVAKGNVRIVNQIKIRRGIHKKPF